MIGSWVWKSHIQVFLHNANTVIWDTPGACINVLNSQEFGCSRVGQFEALNKKLYEKASVTPQFTATKYQ